MNYFVLIYKAKHSLKRLFSSPLFASHFITCFFIANGFCLGFNHLNAELNPICYLLALLGAHLFLHVSRIRVKSLILGY